jgi:lysophospholipase L1-like esterase
MASGTLAKSYPEDLRELLAARYASQTIVVVNAGCGGESTTPGGGPPCTGGVSRLPAVLDTVHPPPEVLLLEEGINDLSGGSASAIQPMIDALRSMVREGKGRGLPVFLATLPPVRSGGTPPRGNGPLPLLSEANAQIRLVAQSEHATLVDLYEGLGASPDPYIDIDGLHPTEVGYQKIAQLFFDAIRISLELQPGVASAMELVRNMPSQNPPFTRIR